MNGSRINFEIDISAEKLWVVECSLYVLDYLIIIILIDYLPGMSEWDMVWCVVGFELVVVAAEEAVLLYVNAL